jgi:outer membrane protein assembly factor BamE (lipoprotein component of BamABCDE complex)
MRNRTAVTLLLAGSLMTLIGCASGSHSVSTSGQAVGSQTLSRLEADVTTEDEMFELLGTPTRSVQSGGGGQIYVYEYERTVSAQGKAFFSSGGTTVTQRRTVSVMVRDGVVRSWWVDGDTSTESAGAA